MLIDSHAHINDPKLFEIADVIVADYRKSGVGAVVNAAYDLESAKRGAELAERYEDCYFTVGLHPHDSKDATAELYDQLIELAKSEKAVAWGETGLDYYYDLSPRDVQHAEFVKQLEIADSLKLPVVIHLRDAYKDFNKLIKDNIHYLKNGVLLHCYSGSAELANSVYNKMDWYYSFGGAVTFAKNKGEVLKNIPLDRLMLETDCPYMTPVPYRGKQNRPSYIYLVRDKIAEILNISSDDIEEITTHNAKSFYKRIK